MTKTSARPPRRRWPRSTAGRRPRPSAQPSSREPRYLVCILQRSLPGLPRFCLQGGVIEDTEKREDLAKLFRFTSTNEDAEEQTVSLLDYVDRMQEGQKTIYYVTAENYATAKNSPHLEIFREKDLEVLLLTDPIDEWLTTHLTEFDGKPLQSVSKGDLDLGEIEDKENKEKTREKDKEYDSLIKQIKEVLDERVQEVRITHRLTTSPACLVTGENDMGRYLEQILKASGQEIPGSKPILEVNPEHPILVRLKDEADEDKMKDWAFMLFDQALLSEGGQLEDPAGFVHRINNMFVELAPSTDETDQDTE